MVINTKILHINSNYIYTDSHQLLIRNLNKTGCENKVFAPIAKGRTGKVVPDDCVTVSYCFNKCDRYFFYFKQRKIIKAAQNALDINDFDVIHAYTLFTDGNAAYKLSKKHGVPYVVAVRSTDVNLFLKKRVHLRRRGIKILLNAAKVFFLSESYEKQVFDKYIPKKYQEQIQKKVTVIPNGIDNFWFENKFEAGAENFENGIKLVYVGEINHNKNILTTQVAMEQLKTMGKKVSLTVVGSVSDKAVFDEVMKNPDTLYIEDQPKEKLIEIYRKSDIFVMPSFSETFGLVYAEAMSQGLPVIYSAGQGFDGQFPEGEVGYRVDSHSSSDVAQKICLIIEKYKEISVNCNNGIEKFSWQDIAGKYYKIYGELTSGENH